jgi:hypothetical protein
VSKRGTRKGGKTYDLVDVGNLGLKDGDCVSDGRLLVHLRTGSEGSGAHGGQLGLAELCEELGQHSRLFVKTLYFLNIVDIKGNLLHCNRYSTRGLLNEFHDSKKFKVNGVTLNPYQKPLLLYMKHILCWSQDGDLIIDATSGSGTTAVRTTKIFLHIIA